VVAIGFPSDELAGFSSASVSAQRSHAAAVRCVVNGYSKPVVR